MSQTRWMLLVVILCTLAASCSLAQQPPTKTLHVLLSTEVQAPMVMPGMGAMPDIPGMPKAGAVQHLVTGRAEYAQAPVEPIFLTVPADLTLKDNRLLLHVPKAATTVGEEKPDEEGEGTTKTVEFVNNLYWHPDVAEGPVTESLKMEAGGKGRAGRGPGMPDMSRLVDDMLGKEADGSESKLPANVRGLGNYVCNTGGTATLDGFLPALKVTAPDMGKLKLDEPTTITWEPVPGARGYLIMATGMKMEGGGDANKMTMTSWFSTLVQPPMRIRGGYQQETTIADDLQNGILLPGNTTSCVMPGGMFPDINMLTLRVQAIGNDFYSNTGGITVFGTIRSEWRAMAMIMNMGGDNE